MALTPFFGRRSGSVFDPLSLDNAWDPFHNLRLWDPFEESSSLGLTPSRQFAQDVAAVANTQVDWLETPDAHVFKVNLPGLRKEEIKVQVVDNNVLQISGARKKENVEQTDRWHRVERASGSFFRSFRLPAHAQVNDLKAQVENGVLTINVPKLPQPTSANVKSITIS